MAAPLILASQSPIRQHLLATAGIAFTAEPARIDEDAVRASLLAEGATPRDLADTLAEMKAAKVAGRHPEGFVLGSDQILDLEGEVLGKPRDPADLVAQLGRMSGRRHQLLSAAVIHEGGKPVWRHVGVARMQMRALSPAFIEAYAARNWEAVRHGVGGYQIEGEGMLLFSRIEGDFFTVQGLPLMEVISYLSVRGLVAL